MKTLLISMMALSIFLGVTTTYAHQDKRKAALTRIISQKYTDVLASIGITREPKYHYHFDVPWQKFSEGLAVVYHHRKYGYINEQDEIVIKSQFNKARAFSEGRAAVQINNGKWGFINKRGKMVMTPRFDHALSFSEGVAAVSLNGKWGFIEKLGNKWAIEPQFEDAYSFSKGLAPVKLNGKYGYINKKNEVVIQYQFDHARPFNKRFAAVEIDGKYGYIDKNGSFSENLILKGIDSHTGHYKKYGYVNEQDEWVIHPQFNRAFDFLKGLALVEINGEYSFITKANEIVTDRKDLRPLIPLSKGMTTFKIHGESVDLGESAYKY